MRPAADRRRGRDPPAPSSRPCLGPRTVVGGQPRRRSGHPKHPPDARRHRATAGTGRRGRTHHTKTDIVVPVVRVVPVAVGAARVVLVVVPGPAAQHPRTRSRAAPPILPTAPAIMPRIGTADQPLRQKIAKALPAQRLSGTSDHDGDEHTTRKPKPSSRKSGLPPPRSAQRAPSREKLQDPPRSTRGLSSCAPVSIQAEPSVGALR